MTSTGSVQGPPRRFGRLRDALGRPVDRVRDLRTTLVAKELAAVGVPARDVLRQRSSQTVFVLANGPSIRDLTAPAWSMIGGCDSIGMNFWLYHSFVPRFYHIELTYEPVEMGGARSAYHHFLDALEGRADYAGVTWMVGKEHAARLLKTRDVRTHVQTFARRRRVYYYPCAFPQPSSSLDESYFAAAARSLSDPHLKPAANSLGAVLSLAFTMGYQDIVLLGVDLNSSDYFWTGDGRSDVHKERAWGGATAGPHPTLAPARGEPVDRWLLAYRDHVLTPAGVRLWIGSPRSALYPRLPLYELPTGP